MTKLYSWNVNGLRACMEKGFREFLEREQPDVLCLQETKMQPHQADFDFPGYEVYWNSAVKKGYSGTAVLTKEKPLSVSYDLGFEDKHNTEGRAITVEYPEYYLVCVYVPNAQDGLKRIDYRMEWEDDFRAYVGALKEKKPVIVTGDMNVAKEEIDLKNPTVEMQDFLIRNVIRCGNCWQADLWIPSGICIRSRQKLTAGGLTVSRQERGMQAGVLTISWCPKEWRTGSKTARFCRISLAVIIVRWN